MDNSGAKAALKGYRLQALYILSEILNSQNANFEFQPEGEEDLAIYNGGDLVSVVQVKARSEALSISSFTPDKEDSFFHRVVKVLNEHPNSTAHVVSFGDIGPEIQKAWEGDEKSQKRIEAKLDKHNIPISKSKNLFKKLEWKTVSETGLLENINNTLRSSITAGNPEHAFDLLTFWLYTASEKKSKITHKKLTQKISSVGEYFAQREAYHLEWFKAIKPLVESTSIDKQVLSEEFYRGVSTRFSHVQADLDVRRTELLERLDELLNATRTVIIHGASGQGKSTLAYRYLYDYVPEHWRFVIQNVDDRKHAQSIAAAITDHLAVFQLPVYLYIEVSPRDSEWPQLVKSLLDCQNVKIIVSIREEDLARQAVPNDELGLPSFLPLRFSKHDAIQIYDSLIVGGLKQAYPSGRQAWLAFGGKGSLLEFVYFLTQTETLESRLRSQINRIKEEVREGKIEPAIVTFLFCCAIATAFESRVQVGRLAQALKIIDPAYLLSLLEKEYLLRLSSDQLYIEALHPIRSKLLSEIMEDPAFSPLSTALEHVVVSVHESDLYSLLLHVFALRPGEVDSVVKVLTVSPPQTWNGVSGVCRALIWRGVAQHISENAETIQHAREFGGNGGWGFALNPDVVGILDEDTSDVILTTLGKANPQAVDNVRSLKRKMTSRNLVFKYLRAWLETTSLNINQPETESEWGDLGVVLLWLSHLNIEAGLDLEWVLDIDAECTFLIIEPLAAFLEGLYAFDQATYERFILQNKEVVEGLYQRDTDTVKIEWQPRNPIAHYIIPKSSLDAYGLDNLNELSVRRAELLKKLFPDNEKYGAKGYGHQNPLIELPFDESEKLGIFTTALPTEEFVNVNAVWGNYANYVVRPDNWKSYIEEIVKIREELVDGLVVLNSALIPYFKTKNQISTMGGRINEADWDSLAKLNLKLPMLPKIAVDPWGITSESTRSTGHQKDKNQSTINLLAIQSQYKAHIKALSDYVSSLTSFYSQSKNIILVHERIGRMPPDEHHHVLSKVEALGEYYSDRGIHLSIVNLNDARKYLNDMQVEFRNQFSSLVNLETIKKLEKKEQEKFNKTWPLWFQFARQPEAIWKSNPLGKAVSIMNIEQAKLRSKIEYELKNMDSERFDAKIVDAESEYEGKKSLWIQVECCNLAAIDEIFEKVVTALTHAIRPLEVTALKYFVLTNVWTNIIVIPTVQGASLSNSSWVLLSATFAGEEPVLNEEKPWLSIPRLLTRSQVAKLGFGTKQTSYNSQMTELERELSALFNVVVHLSNFDDLTENLDDLGIEVLTHYLSKLSPEIKQYLEKIMRICNDVETTDEDVERLIEKCRSAALSYDMKSDLEVSLSEFKDWLELIHAAMSDLQLFTWSMLEKTANVE